MALDAAECRDLATLAAEGGRFLMEAMWTLFLPRFDAGSEATLMIDGLFYQPGGVAGDQGSALRPVSDTIATMEVMDVIRLASSG